MSTRVVGMSKRVAGTIHIVYKRGGGTLHIQSVDDTRAGTQGEGGYLPNLELLDDRVDVSAAQRAFSMGNGDVLVISITSSEALEVGQCINKWMST